MATLTTREPILVVEDDDVLRDLLKSVLEDEGYLVTAVASGDKALCALESGALPSLILLDLMMPRFSGWEFLCVRAKSARLQAVPIVVMTALDAAHRGEIAAEALVTKPFDLDQLLITIAAVLKACGDRRERGRRHSGWSDQLP